LKILFVKANKIGSKIIRWGLNEPASHVAVQFGTSAMVYHSYLTGIREAHETDFHTDYDIVSEIDLDLFDESFILSRFEDAIPKKQTYDYPALFYFAWRGFLYKYFHRPFPRLNSWQEGGGFLCTEITYILAEILAEELAVMILPEDKDIAMVSPWTLYQLLKDNLSSKSMPFKVSNREWV